MLNILFPRTCNGCGKVLLNQEYIVCSRCRHQLPIACFHRNNDRSLLDVFYGRIPLVNATAVLQYQKTGPTQQLLHNLKYRGREEVGVFFGNWLGQELSNLSAYGDIDLVIPVPLHKRKLKKRGYNQVSGFGKAIAKALGVPMKEDILIKTTKTASQVFKKRWTRFSADEIFEIRNLDKAREKHILLVDDIVTTGATLEKCANQLLQIEGVALSVATIAIA